MGLVADLKAFEASVDRAAKRVSRRAPRKIAHDLTQSLASGLGISPERARRRVRHGPGRAWVGTDPIPLHWLEDSVKTAKTFPSGARVIEPVDGLTGLFTLPLKGGSAQLVFQREKGGRRLLVADVDRSAQMAAIVDDVARRSGGDVESIARRVSIPTTGEDDIRVW